MLRVSPMNCRPSSPTSLGVWKRIVSARFGMIAPFVARRSPALNCPTFGLFNSGGKGDQETGGIDHIHGIQAEVNAHVKAPDQVAVARADDTIGAQEIAIGDIRVAVRWSRPPA